MLQACKPGPIDSASVPHPIKSYLKSNLDNPSSFQLIDKQIVDASNIHDLLGVGFPDADQYVDQNKLDDEVHYYLKFKCKNKRGALALWEIVFILSDNKRSLIEANMLTVSKASPETY